jgi:hypothetical protein
MMKKVHGQKNTFSDRWLTFTRGGQMQSFQLKALHGIKA